MFFRSLLPIVLYYIIIYINIFSWFWRGVNLYLLQIYQKLAVYLTDWGK